MASIIADHSTEEAHVGKLQGWKGKDLQSLNIESFSAMMAEVRTLGDLRERPI